MTTTALFIEIFLIGSVSTVWIGLFTFGLLPSGWLTLQVVEIVSKLSFYLLFVFVALTYVFGWIVYFLGERLLEPFLQVRFRRDFFAKSAVDYDNVRAAFYQGASKPAMDDLNYDRQIIRISRSSVLNFLLIAVALWINIGAFPVNLVGAGIAISLSVSLLSFLQWTSQYRRSYAKMLDTYRVLVASESRSSGLTENDTAAGS